MSRYLLRSVFAATLAITAGCSASQADPLGATQQALFANDKTAYDYFVGKGLTSFQAAGVVGNLDQESGIDPTIHQAGGGVGRGIAQWSAGARWDTTNNDNVVAYAAQHGQSATSLGLQLDFIWYELTTFPEYGLTQLQATTNLTDATTIFEDMFEGCVYASYPECALPSRINFAKGILNAYGADTGQGGQGGGGGGGTSATGGASGAGGTSISGTSGSNSTSVGGGASGGSGSGGGAGGTPLSGAAGTSSAGNVSVAGASSSAGSTTIAGSAAIAGSTGVAGGATSAGAPGFTAPANTRDDSSCAVAWPTEPQHERGVAFYVLGAWWGSTCLLRRKARSRLSRRAASCR